ncbi:hypothetical protein N802_08845 [Knoellia sinensis KCTC 19936]|uniref:Uncharacterized protein n=1 Tax=Knoellia sinensis KCTC 19936 TaxID=1385520 RepID=A0A0A0JD91_9MICO|nr:hypothetical protein [Knoellia sinensis]KGN33982.1 hypothetical protein N802_08845 [Knoellia sinensis KCTC 19936]
MNGAEELRVRAGRWRLAAEATRAELRLLVGVSELSWRSSSAEEFRRLISRRVRELRELAEREDAVADLLDRVASEAERAA